MAKQGLGSEDDPTLRFIAREIGRETGGETLGLAASDEESGRLTLNLVMDGGTVSDFGTHDELLMRSPIYREVYESQTKTSPDAAKKGDEAHV